MIVGTWVFDAVSEAHYAIIEIWICAGGHGEQI
jgi:hypothetical protein